MDDIATGKRKSDDDAAASACLPPHPTRTLFSWLSDENWILISSYSAPPDVYNLSLSSVHFFHEFSTLPGIKPHSSSASSTTATNARKSKKINRGRRSKRLTESAAAAEKNAASSSDEKVLATQLLRTSLLSSLNRVLEAGGSGLTLDALLKMGDGLPEEGGAIIAGSTMVAACLGKMDWRKSDVDVYCSAKAAPHVRSVSKKYTAVVSFCVCVAFSFALANDNFLLMKK